MERQETSHEERALVELGSVDGDDDGRRLLLVGRAQLPACGLPGEQLLPAMCPGVRPGARLLPIGRRLVQSDRGSDGQRSRTPGSQFDDVGPASRGSAADQSNLVAFELWVASHEGQVFGTRLSNE